MNDNQLEDCLKNLMASQCGPASVDARLEERIMIEFSKSKSKRRRTRRLAFIGAVFLICGTGFVALGGDLAVMNYISPTSAVDASGNPVSHSESRWSGFCRHVHVHLMHIHNHLWDHWRSHHGESNVPQEPPISTDESPEDAAN